jgi:hypothetical protein
MEAFMGRRASLAAVWALGLGLVGCGAPAIAPMMTAAPMVDAQGANLSDDDVTRLVRLISAEAGQSGANLDPAKLRKANQDLIRDRALREKAYKTSDTIIDRLFNRPGKADAIPRLNAQDMQTFKSKLQAGDVIQCGNDGSFIHGVFYVGRDVIIHALAEPMNGKRMIGVVKETLTDYFARVERDQVVVLRPHWSPAQLKTAVAFAEAQVGKGYDSLFLTESPDRFYCTELVYKTLTAAKVARIQPRLVKDAWPIVMNEELRQSPDLSVVYTKNHD